MRVYSLLIITIPLALFNANITSLLIRRDNLPDWVS